MMEFIINSHCGCILYQIKFKNLKMSFTQSDLGLWSRVHQTCVIKVIEWQNIHLEKTLLEERNQAIMHFYSKIIMIEKITIWKELKQFLLLNLYMYYNQDHLKGLYTKIMNLSQTNIFILLINFYFLSVLFLFIFVLLVLFFW